MKASKNKKTINIATPVVWAETLFLNQYIESLSRLVEEVNKYLNGKNFGIGEVMIDAYTDMDCSDFLARIQKPDNFKVACYSRGVHAINGMGYCWFKSVDRAFGGSSFDQVDRVLYYPVDASFERSPENTVSEPSKITALMEVLQAGGVTEERLVIGNYTSSDEKKDDIEAVVRLIIEKEFPNLIPEIMRVRSEYWGISPKLFADFKEFYFKNIHHKEGFHPVKDPSLLILIYGLCRDKKVISFDLGKYKEETARNIKKRKNQVIFWIVVCGMSLYTIGKLIYWWDNS